MNRVIWALETYEDEQWHPRVVDKRWNSSTLRFLWQGCKEDVPHLPRRIKVYVRWSDVRDQQHADERAIAWAEGPDVKWPLGAEPARIYKLDEPGSPAQTVGPGSIGRGGAVVVTLCQKETS